MFAVLASPGNAMNPHNAHPNPESGHPQKERIERLHGKEKTIPRMLAVDRPNKKSGISVPSPSVTRLEEKRRKRDRKEVGRLGANYAPFVASRAQSRRTRSTFFWCFSLSPAGTLPTPFITWDVYLDLFF